MAAGVQVEAMRRRTVEEGKMMRVILCSAKDGSEWLVFTSEDYEVVDYVGKKDADQEGFQVNFDGEIDLHDFLPGDGDVFKR